MFKKTEEIFSFEKIESIKNSVRQVMKDRYGDSIERAEIAIGNFYNGVALIYIGWKQLKPLRNSPLILMGNL